MATKRSPKCSVYNNICGPALCIIFNYSKYCTSQDRQGSTKDAEDLKTTLSKFNCNVEVWTDCRGTQTLNILQSLKKLEYYQYSALLIFFLAHGDLQGIFTSDETHIPINHIQSCLQVSECPAFKKKPKLLVFQCCRTTSGNHKRPEPIEQDFLIAFATQQDTPATRDTMNGSPYIQCLIRAIEEFGGTEDILSILTEVTKSMDESNHIHHQLPDHNTLLTRKFYFSHKPPSGSELITDEKETRAHRLLVAKRVHTLPNSNKSKFSHESSDSNSSNSLNLSVPNYNRSQATPLTTKVKAIKEVENDDGYVYIITKEITVEFKETENDWLVLNLLEN